MKGRLMSKPFLWELRFNPIETYREIVQSILIIDPPGTEEEGVFIYLLICPIS